MSEYQGPGFGVVDTFTPDNLFGGDFPLVTQDVTILSGQNLQRGAVVGRITASGKWRLSLAASSDGSEVPRAVLAKSVHADGADALRVPVYRTGIFNARRLILGAGHTIESIREGLIALSIYIKSTVAAG